MTLWLQGKREIIYPQKISNFNDPLVGSDYEFSPKMIMTTEKNTEQKLGYYSRKTFPTQILHKNKKFQNNKFFKPIKNRGKSKLNDKVWHLMLCLFKNSNIKKW